MSTGATKTWVTSDLHLMHNGVCKFLRNDGSKLRPWHDAEIMTNDLVANFNDMVGEKDKCYFLGDMSINRRGLDHIGRLDVELKGGSKEPLQVRIPQDVKRRFKAYAAMRGMASHELFVEVWAHYERTRV